MDNDTFRLNNTIAVLRELAKGKKIILEGHPFPIAMGEDFAIGYVHPEKEGTIMVQDFTFPELVQMFGDLIVLPEV